MANGLSPRPWLPACGPAGCDAVPVPRSHPTHRDQPGCPTRRPDRPVAPGTQHRSSWRPPPRPHYAERTPPAGARCSSPQPSMTCPSPLKTYQPATRFPTSGRPAQASTGCQRRPQPRTTTPPPESRPVINPITTTRSTTGPDFPRLPLPSTTQSVMLTPGQPSWFTLRRITIDQHETMRNLVGGRGVTSPCGTCRPHAHQFEPRRRQG